MASFLLWSQHGRARVISADQRTSTPAALRWHVSGNRLTIRLPPELDEPTLWNDIKNDTQLLYSNATGCKLNGGDFREFELVAVAPGQIQLKQAGVDFTFTWTRAVDMNPQ